MMPVMEVAKKRRVPIVTEPTPQKRRESVVGLKGLPEWKEWLGGLAEFDAQARRADANISDTIDRALAFYAQHIGYKAVPPKR
jgi:hypothetical protein